jgi:hypothetical protein
VGERAGQRSGPHPEVCGYPRPGSVRWQTRSGRYRSSSRFRERLGAPTFLLNAVAHRRHLSAIRCHSALALGIAYHFRAALTFLCVFQELLMEIHARAPSVPGLRSSHSFVFAWYLDVPSIGYGVRTTGSHSRCSRLAWSEALPESPALAHRQNQQMLLSTRQRA